MDYAKLKKSNVFQIIQIFDTDGTYIDESHIMEGDTEEFVYSETEISCKYPERVKARNIHKKELMNFLLGEKEKYADKFQQMFIGKEERFIPYIKNLAAKDMPKSHPGSWRYIKEERHSLERNSNLLYKMETIRESVKRGMAAQFTVLQVLLYLSNFYKFPLYTKISLVIWQDIGYTLRIPI